MNVRTTLKVVTIGIGTVVMANAAANIAMRTMAKTGGSVVSAGYMTLEAIAKLATPAPVTYHRLVEGLGMDPDWMQPMSHPLDGCGKGGLRVHDFVVDTTPTPFDPELPLSTLRQRHGYGPAGTPGAPDEVEEI